MLLSAVAGVFAALNCVAAKDSRFEISMSSPDSKVNGQTLSYGTGHSDSGKSGSLTAWNVDNDQSPLFSFSTNTKVPIYLGLANGTGLTYFPNATQAALFKLVHYNKSYYLELPDDGPTVSGSTFHVAYQGPSNYTVHSLKADIPFNKTGDFLVNLRIKTSKNDGSHWKYYTIATIGATGIITVISVVVRSILFSELGQEMSLFVVELAAMN